MSRSDSAELLAQHKDFQPSAAVAELGLSAFQSHCQQPGSISGHALSGWQRLPQLDVEGNASERVHLLHGNGFCGLTLAQVSRFFPRDWGLFFTDLPGHGGSQFDQPEAIQQRMPDWQAMAQSVIDGLDQRLGYLPSAGGESQRNVVGIGHSMGGVVTLLAAVKRPDLFSRIILLDPVLFGPELIAAQHMLRASGAWKRNALVKSVNRRRQHWPDAQEMYNDLAQKGLYRNWQADCLADFVNGAASPAADGGVELACDPRWEAAIFGSYPRGLWKAVKALNVPVDILIAQKSYGFIPRAVKRAGQVNRCVRWQAFGDTHCFPMEQPRQTAGQLMQMISQAVVKPLSNK